MLDVEISKLKKFIKSRQDELQIPGIGLGIIKNKEIVFSGGFGFRNMRFHLIHTSISCKILNHIST
ncbi:MAG: hypothetical protein R6U96_13045 [Promethearchaeia archaeon]